LNLRNSAQCTRPFLTSSRQSASPWRRATSAGFIRIPWMRAGRTCRTSCNTKKSRNLPSGTIGPWRCEISGASVLWPNSKTSGKRVGLHCVDAIECAVAFGGSGLGGKPDSRERSWRSWKCFAAGDAERGQISLPERGYPGHSSHSGQSGGHPAHHRDRCPELAVGLREVGGSRGVD
jgi:hypothetical protein